MSALAVLSGTGMLITTFNANSLLLKALFAFTFTCSQTFAFISCLPPHFRMICFKWQTYSIAHTHQPRMQAFLAACCDCVQASNRLIVLPACMGPTALVLGRAAVNEGHHSIGGADHCQSCAAHCIDGEQSLERQQRNEEQSEWDERVTSSCARHIAWMMTKNQKDSGQLKGKAQAKGKSQWEEGVTSSCMQPIIEMGKNLKRQNHSKGKPQWEQGVTSDRGQE